MTLDPAGIAPDRQVKLLAEVQSTLAKEDGWLFGQPIDLRPGKTLPAKAKGTA